jgi:AcrR family transcriptional regulator
VNSCRRGGSCEERADADQLQSGEVGGAEVDSGGVKRGEVKRGKVKRGKVKSAEVKRGEVKRGDVKRGEVRTSESENGNAKARASRRRPGRREELSAAALEVIRSVGPGASMEEMAAKAGITKPVLYRYFGDRDGLIASVAEQFSEVLIVRLEQALAGAPTQSAETLIRSAVECYIAFIEEDPALYGFLTHQAPLGSPAMVAVIDRIAAALEQVIRVTLESHALDTRPARTWAHGVVGMVHLAGARWVRQPDGPREQFVADLVALIAHGMSGAAAANAALTGESGATGLPLLEDVL